MGGSQSIGVPIEVQTDSFVIESSKVKDKKNMCKEDNLVGNLQFSKSGLKHSAKEPLKYKNLLSLQNHFDIKNEPRNPENSNFQIDLNLLFHELSEICTKMEYFEAFNTISNSKISNTNRLKNSILIISELKHLIYERINFASGIIQKKLHSKAKTKKSKLRTKEEIRKCEIQIKEYTEIGIKLKNIEQKVELVMNKGLSLNQALIDSPEDPIIVTSGNIENHQQRIKEQILFLENLLNENYVCPIGGTILTDPVIDDDGHTYERENILEWFRKSNYSPITHKLMASKNLKPNYFIRSQIEDLKSKIGILKNKINQELK